MFNLLYQFLLYLVLNFVPGMKFLGKYLKCLIWTWHDYRLDNPGALSSWARYTCAKCGKKYRLDYF